MHLPHRLTTTYVLEVHLTHPAGNIRSSTLIFQQKIHSLSRGPGRYISVSGCVLIKRSLPISVRRTHFCLTFHFPPDFYCNEYQPDPAKDSLSRARFLKTNWIGRQSFPAVESSQLFTSGSAHEPHPRYLTHYHKDTRSIRTPRVPFLFSSTQHMSWVTWQWWFGRPHANIWFLLSGAFWVIISSFRMRTSKFNWELHYSNCNTRRM